MCYGIGFTWHTHTQTQTELRNLVLLEKFHCVISQLLFIYTLFSFSLFFPLFLSPFQCVDILRPFLCGHKPIQESANLHRVHRRDVSWEKTPRDASTHLRHIRGSIQKHVARYYTQPHPPCFPCVTAPIDWSWLYCRKTELIRIQSLFFKNIVINSTHIGFSLACHMHPEFILLTLMSSLLFCRSRHGFCHKNNLKCIKSFLFCCVMGVFSNALLLDVD